MPVHKPLSERVTLVSFYPVALMAAALLAAVAVYVLALPLPAVLRWLCILAAAILAAVGADWLSRVVRR